MHRNRDNHFEFFDIDTKKDTQNFRKFIYFSMLVLSGVSLFINIRHYLKLKRTFDSINAKYKNSNNSGFYKNKNETQELDQKKLNKAKLTERISRIQNQNKEWKLIK